MPTSVECVFLNGSSCFLSILFFSCYILTKSLHNIQAKQQNKKKGPIKPVGGQLLLPFHPTWHPAPAPPAPPKPPKPNISNANCKPTQHTTPSLKTLSPKHIYHHNLVYTWVQQVLLGQDSGCLQGSKRKWGKARRLQCTLTNAIQLKAMYVTSVMLGT